MTSSTPLNLAEPYPLRHLAVIMDGNRRWAKERRLPTLLGHRSGAERVRELVRLSADHGIEYLTLFAFSTENWRRPEDEVTGLMRLLKLYLQHEVKQLKESGVRLRVLGFRDALNVEIRNLIDEAEATTAAGTKLNLNVAINYGGQADIVQAVQTWLKQHPNANPTDFNAQILAQNLATAHSPDPDLLIRTGGECRISNFMIWQLAYTELYFTQALWPDFDGQEFKKAIHWYQSRDRRFGGSGTKGGG